MLLDDRSRSLRISPVSSSQVEEFSSQFLGFGAPHSPLWFVSYNPHFGRVAEHWLLGSSFDDEGRREAMTRRRQQTMLLIRLWLEKHMPTVGRSAYLSQAGLSLLRTSPGSKLERLAKLYKALCRKLGIPCAGRSISGDALGTAEAPAAFLAELNAIERSVFYDLKRTISLPWRAHGYYRSYRAEIIRKAISMYAPRAVVFAGWTGGRYWEKITNVPLYRRRLIDGASVAVTEAAGTIWMAIPAPFGFQLSDMEFDQLTRILYRSPLP